MLVFYFNQVHLKWGSLIYNKLKKKGLSMCMFFQFNKLHFEVDHSIDTSCHYQKIVNIGDFLPE